MRISSCRAPRSVPGSVWVVGSLMCGTGHVFGIFSLRLCDLWRIPCHFPFPSSPPWGAGGDLGQICYSYWGTGGSSHFLSESAAFPSTLSRPTPLTPLLRVVWRWAFSDDLFLSLSVRPSFLPLFFSASPVGLVTLPFRGVGVGLEGPRLRLVFYSSSYNRGFLR